ncbi:EF-P lysine aminoacylase EpmA [Pseudobacteriovorax antillogorgiicola]|uniref:Lysyl-tRNA synthetase, class 2 n=1 Tax=Pseudobacteriovorax antillogorgiicola TaxID=1513793 RepID=A0A1Y6BPY0_9BACT|nr:EF-P lysine aminoacylase EpmA [Pseudobacteriovorax antillogorgiicola]TCS55308.1 lysyl-tRNA synthetase class 2 [Pseudobacteriovorax antillogorgiicola]SMF14394.1 lysyl-tRNA synthetase, class 2 [Pseudobacteriovorax antillogorgiicola]
MTKALSFKECYYSRYTLKRAIENFFHKRDYIEVDTPIIVPTPGTEVHLDYFETSWLDFQLQSHQRFLRSSPELHLKQALAQGLDRIYHLGRCFRNGGEASAWHHPEFTMLEWYEAGISYEDFMQQTEELVRYSHRMLQTEGYSVITLPSKIEALTVAEAFERFAGIELIDQDPDLAEKANRKNFVSIRPDDDFETSFFKIMLDAVEPCLAEFEAVFLYDYPASQAALATVEQGVAKRFELYIKGIELSNAFQELTSPQDNIRRIHDSNHVRQTLSKQAVPIDDCFVDAVNKGIPESCGNALGFDRLLAILLGLDSIDSIIPFRENPIFPLEAP